MEEEARLKEEGRNWWCRIWANHDYGQEPWRKWLIRGR